MHQRLSNQVRFAILACPLIAGCTAWHVDTRPPEVVVAKHADGHVAVSMQDLRWVVLRNPRVENDSIIGTRVAGNSPGHGRTALALPKVTAVETKRFSLVRTIAFAAVVAFLPTVWRFATVEE